jgi:hypothetical protein
MKVMVKLTSKEVADLQYPVVIESWKHVMGPHKCGSKRRLYESTFTETERDKIAKWHAVFYKWHVGGGGSAYGLGGGVPQDVVMSPEDLIWLQSKVIPFFANI